jgi:hypothetical protein
MSGGGSPELELVLYVQPIETLAMQLPPVRFTIWQLMVGIAGLAVVCRFGGSVVRHPSPRSFLPPLMILYMAWASYDGARIIGVGQTWLRRRISLALTGLALLIVVVTAANNRWADFRERGRFHARQELLCRLSAEGKSGQLISCGEGVCEATQIPRSESPAERAEMLRLADYHSCRVKYYQSRW